LPIAIQPRAAVSASQVTSSTFVARDAVVLGERDDREAGVSE
jgi:hypothetical protein